MKKKLTVTTAVALAAALILAAAAFAASTSGGLLDLLTGSLADRPQVLPQATAIVESDIEQEGGDTGDAVFRMREAIYDGEHIYMTVAVQPRDDKTLLLGDDSEPGDPMSNYGPDFTEEASIRSWAEENGYERMLSASVYWDGLDSVDYRLEPDGTLLFLLEGSEEDGPEKLDLTLRCMTVPCIEKNPLEYIRDFDGKSETTLTFTLESTGYFAGKESWPDIEIPEAGLKVTYVWLKATPVTVYTEIRYEITDADKYNACEDGVWFRFVDEDGRPLPSGVMSGGSNGPVDEKYLASYPSEFENGTEFVQKDDLQATETLPDSLFLEAYNCWDKNTYGTFEVRFD